MTVQVLIGDCRDVLRSLPAESVHCCVTSPPYFGLRDYGVGGQIGLEPSPDEFIATMVEVFREVRRVLRADGTCWVNLGDSYWNGGGIKKDGGHGFVDGGKKKLEAAKGSLLQARFSTQLPVKPKDLLMIPARVALALQQDGWWLRSDIIWAKPNPMPESVTDRPTSAHEHMFLLAKSARYFYDADAVREAYQDQNHPVGPDGKFLNPKAAGGTGMSFGQGPARDGLKAVGRDYNPAGRNLRNVWTIATAPFSEAHFATFPPALVEPCIKAGTSERGCCSACGAPWRRETVESADERKPYATLGTGAKATASRNDGIGPNKVLRADGKGGDLATIQRTTTGWSPSCSCPPAAPIPCTVLDPFGGAGTTGLVADRLQRNAVLIELNPDYAAMARRRISSDAPLLQAAQ